MKKVILSATVWCCVGVGAAIAQEDNTQPQDTVKTQVSPVPPSDTPVAPKPESTSGDTPATESVAPPTGTLDRPVEGARRGVPAAPHGRENATMPRQ